MDGGNWRRNLDSSQTLIFHRIFVMNACNENVHISVVQMKKSHLFFLNPGLVEELFFVL